MNLLDDLTRQRGLYANCPSCSEGFRVSDARLFDATKKLPTYAINYLTEQRAEIRDAQSDLKVRKDRAKNRAKVTAESVGVGKIVEKIAPSLPGFPVISSDCRSLFEPIDYVVFPGLSKDGIVQAVHFVDVKSGGARLNPVQKQIQKAVQDGKVSLLIAPRPKVEVV